MAGFQALFSGQRFPELGQARLAIGNMPKSIICGNLVAPRVKEAVRPGPFAELHSRKATLRLSPHIDIDFETIWEVVVNDLPQLESAILAILTKISPATPSVVLSTTS